MNKLSRRNLLGIFTLLAGCTSSLEKPSFPAVGRGPFQKVPDGTNVHRIWPTDSSMASDCQRVDEGNWIEHTFSWYTIEDEGPRELEELRKRTTHHVSIDGKARIDADRHWKPITKDRDGSWRLSWSYINRPRPIGEYKFSVTIDFDQPFTSKRATGERETHSGTYWYSGRYKVVPGYDSLSKGGISDV